MPGPDRRTILADAAITTLARQGSRGLTHRAVDRTAGLAEGTTSFYFRTRQALLDGIVARLAELDTAIVVDLPATTLDEFADAVTDLVGGILHRGGERQIVRYELALEANRRPELRDALTAPAVRLRELITERFTALGVDDAADRARDFLLLVDGLLFDQLVAPWAGRLDHTQLRALIGRLLTAVDAIETPEEQ